ncbi:MAG TPA: protein-glutamate O-methyltransferase [Treponemataceae bacterium]|nr:protein-glutamate O-methyltransferase [Treponemataceae bacterium]HPS44481.1 protein-glutamate O-methyltransferase [Treponemataceae bacterium]
MADFLSDADFDQYRKLIYDESGITFSSTNRAILESRLRERLREKQITHVSEYYALLLKDKEELKLMLDSVTTNLTRFFRNQPHFDALVNYIIPEVLKIKKEKGDTKIRVWSAGCSTGEEPYTLAMLFKDKLPAPYSAEILASDISLKSLMVGKSGFYPESRIVGIPDAYLNRFFEHKNNGYQAKDEIMKMIRFDYHNLKNDSGQRGLDILFCRNVLIYFDEAAQKAVIDRFWDAMAAKSFLFIGHSESLFGMKTKFEFLKTDWACLYQKNA